MVFGICRLIDILVPDVPESLELKIKRERYLAKQALADTEALLLVSTWFTFIILYKVLSKTFEFCGCDYSTNNIYTIFQSSKYLKVNTEILNDLHVILYLGSTLNENIPHMNKVHNT